MAGVGGWGEERQPKKKGGESSRAGGALRWAEGREEEEEEVVIKGRLKTASQCSAATNDEMTARHRGGQWGRKNRTAQCTSAAMSG